MSFAENTKVPWERSRDEIEKILKKYEASSFGYGWEEEKALIFFQMHQRHLRFTVKMPKPEDFREIHGRWRERSFTQQKEKCDQETRRRWRALLLVIKAKLEAVESGISEFEDEFLAHIMLPNGKTAGQWMRPQIKVAYDRGVMPTLLLGAGDEDDQ